LARDLYDLAWFAPRPLDDNTVRRLWMIKVYFDIVDDGRGQPPISPDDVLSARDPRRFTGEEIGYLTQPVDIEAWIATVRSRYQFLAHLRVDERRWALCNAGHRREVIAAVAALARSGTNC
jgi:predicted nucleotidyltransferase component of viral defense system